MFVTYLVVAVAYVFSAFAGYALVTAVDHLDAPELPPANEATTLHELKLAS